MRWILALAIVLGGCATARAKHARSNAEMAVSAAQLRWNECSVNPDCKGDEMFKRQADLQKARADAIKQLIQDRRTIDEMMNETSDSR